MPKSSYRTAWTGPATPTHDYVVPVSPLVGEFLLGWFLNDAVGDNFNWPTGWTEISHQQTTTNSMDVWMGKYGPCKGSETTWTFTDDSGVSKLLGGVTAFSGIDQRTPLAVIDQATGARFIAGVTDSNMTSPWTQAVTANPQYGGYEYFAVMGHDLFPSTNDLTVTLSGSETLGNKWTARDRLDDPFAGPSSGFCHIGTISAQQPVSGSNTITLTGTCSDPTVPAARAVIMVALNLAPTPKPGRMLTRRKRDDDGRFNDLDIKQWFRRPESGLVVPCR